MAAAKEKSPNTSFFDFMYQQALEMLVVLFFSIETLTAAFERFSGHCTY